MKSFQKKSNIIGVVVVILALAVWTFFYSTGGERTVSVSSDDGFLSISWPEGAFPEGVSADDIRIIKKDEKSDQMEYEFLPDGTIFTEPGVVSFTIPAPKDDEPLPFLMLFGDSEPEVLETRYEYSDDLTEVAISAPVSHFSRLRVIAGFFELVRPKEKALYPVGANFTVRIPVFVNLKTTYYRDDDPTPVEVELMTPRVMHIGNAISPIELDTFIQEPEESVITNFFTAVEEGFICKSKGFGQAQVDYRLRTFIRRRHSLLHSLRNPFT